MPWDATCYGAHAETSIAAPATTWYLAEGATHGNFDLFYLLVIVERAMYTSTGGLPWTSGTAALATKLP